MRESLIALIGADHVLDAPAQKEDTANGVSSSVYDMLNRGENTKTSQGLSSACLHGYVDRAILTDIVCFSGSSALF
jgi:hypothetical protein